jgi:OOP family OmpA-OmpF porin
MNTNRRIAALICLVSLLASGAALAQVAQDKRFYVGFGAGQARPDFDSAPAIASGLPVVYDSSSGIWKAFAGYQFNKYFGAELIYVRLGDYNVYLPTVALNTSIQIKGAGGALVGTLPLGKDFSLLGRVGETNIRESRGNCALCAGVVTSSSSNTWSPSFGIGLAYDLNASWSARAEAERFTKVGSSGDSTFGAAINMYSASLAYKF